MSDTSTQTIEPTTERKPPTLADIVREKTDDGRRIIDFFLDVMEDRIDGAELCHRIDAAKQLEKHKSKAAAKFLAKYRGVSCGHSTRGRPDPADPCSAAERSLVAVTLNAPATLTRDFLTVLSGIDEFLMARLIRAQTADGVTVIEFLDDVMQDRNDGFKTHHRIAAAKELIVHIVRDEQPAPNTPVVPAEAGTQWAGGGRSTVANPARTEPVLNTVEGSAHPELVEGSELVAGSVHPEPRQIVIPAESLPRTRYGAGTQGGGGGRSAAANSARTEPVLSTAEGSVHPEPRQIVIPAESLPRTRYGAGTHPPDPVEGPQDNKVRRPRKRRTRTQRRRDGNARAALLGKGSKRNDEEKQDKPAPVELTIAERRIKERLEQHWHEPDPYGAPIDSASPGRSPPW